MASSNHFNRGGSAPTLTVAAAAPVLGGVARFNRLGDTYQRDQLWPEVADLDA